MGETDTTGYLFSVNEVFRVWIISNWVVGQRSPMKVSKQPKLLPRVGLSKQSGRSYFFHFFIRYFLHLHFKCYSESPLYSPPTLLPNLPTPSSWPWHFPVLGHMIFARPRASPHIDGWLGHPLLHMQLETHLWGGQGQLPVWTSCYSQPPIKLYLFTFL